MPKSVSEVRERFTAQIDALRTNAEVAASSVLGSEQYKWPQPDRIGGGPAEAFKREEHNEDMRNAIKDAKSSGTLGDLQVTTLQGDYLACQESAYRMRHSSSIRLAIHAAARRKAHGSESGPLIRGVKGYIENLLRVSKEDS